MALSFASVAGSATVVGGAPRVDHLQHGLQVRQLDMTASLGTTTAASDYKASGGTTGFPMQANAAKMGFRQIFGLIAVSARNSANVPLTMMPVFEPITSKLQFYKTLAAGVGGTEAADNSTDVPAGSIVRLIVIGV